MNNNYPFTIAICSGKGGIGKSSVAANLSSALSKIDRKTLIWDGDLYYPNQRFFFGVEPPINLYDVYSRNASIDEAIYKLDENLYILPDAPAEGKADKIQASMISEGYNSLIQTTKFDFIVIDAPDPGTKLLFKYLEIADLAALLINDDPTSLLDAYALLKILPDGFNWRKIELLANNVIDYEDYLEFSNKMNSAVETFFGERLDTLGYIPYDRSVRQSIIKQKPFVFSRPDSEITRSAIKLAEKITSRVLV